MRIIAGKWGGRIIDAPPGNKTRPTTDRVREAWMSALLPWLEDARVLDLFSGSGALGLETLSRGAAHVTFVENGAALKTLMTNIDKLGAAVDVDIIKKDALSYARSLEPDSFDIALADPPYGQGIAAALVEQFVSKPFAQQLWIEHRVSDKLPETAGSRSRKYGDTIITTISASE